MHKADSLLVCSLASKLAKCCFRCLETKRTHLILNMKLMGVVKLRGPALCVLHYLVELEQLFVRANVG
jgi:hypothetical protein